MRWLSRIGLCAALTAAVLLFLAPGQSAAERLARTYSLASVEVGFDQDAFIDWNSPGSAAFEIERDLIRVLFEGAATDAASSAMIGVQPATLKISVIRFDILSTIELFFCCAVNEVSARFELVEPETGRPLAEAAVLNFDHVGRGGLIGAAAAEDGEDQLQRVARIIRQGAAAWIEDAE